MQGLTGVEEWERRGHWIDLRGRSQDDRKMNNVAATIGNELPAFDGNKD